MKKEKIGKRAETTRQNHNNPTEWLLHAMRSAFTDHPFDIPCILGEADFYPELFEVIKAAIPNCCRNPYRKHPLAHDLFRDRILRPFFTEWAKQHCTTDEAGWWYLKDPPPHAPKPSDGTPDLTD
jgi:hypothetical protein